MRLHGVAPVAKLDINSGHVLVEISNCQSCDVSYHVIGQLISCLVTGLLTEYYRFYSAIQLVFIGSGALQLAML